MYDRLAQRYIGNLAMKQINCNNVHFEIKKIVSASKITIIDEKDFYKNNRFIYILRLLKVTG